MHLSVVRENYSQVGVKRRISLVTLRKALNFSYKLIMSKLHTSFGEANEIRDMRKILK